MVELTKKDEFAEIIHKGIVIAVVYLRGDGTVSIVTNSGEGVKITQKDDAR